MQLSRYAHCDHVITSLLSKSSESALAAQLSNRQG